MLTQKRLKELLHYDPETGVFIRNVTRRGKARAGSVAGSPSRGYLTICVDWGQYKAHRLAWLYVYGTWPTQMIDHIDGNKSNNAISNLRDVNTTINMQNQWKPMKNNKSGFRGVSKNGKKFRANIRVNCRTVHVGTYDTPEEAHAGYLEAKQYYMEKEYALL